MDWLDNDFLGQLRTDAQPNITNLADDIGVLRQKSDFLFFAEAHFAEPVGDFRSSRELFNSNGSACPNVA